MTILLRTFLSVCFSMTLSLIVSSVRAQEVELVLPFDTSNIVDQPTGVGIASTGDIYVVDNWFDLVHVFSPGGELLNQFGQFESPVGLAVSKAGSVYVTDLATDLVSVFDLEGQHLFDLDSTISEPIGVAVDNRNRAYVVSSDAETVQVFDELGALQNTFSTGLSLRPGSATIFVNQSGELIVTDQDGRQLQVFDDTGEFQQVIDVSPRRPTGVVDDQAGNMYLIHGDCVSNQRIEVLDADGNAAGRSSRISSCPYAIDRDETGRIVVTDVENRGTRVRVFRRVTFPGDINGDGELNGFDVDAIQLASTQDYFDPQLDVDGDTLLDTSDIDRLVTEIAGSAYGDSDLDGDVDFGDFVALSQAFGTTIGGSWSQGDFDSNRKVDFEDFVVLSGNFGFERQGGLVRSVPEPNLHWCVGCVCLAMLRRSYTQRGVVRYV